MVGQSNRSSRVSYESPVPFEADRIRAAAVYCSDGRYGDQIDDLLHHALQLPRYDRLAVPGGAACLAKHPAHFFEQESLARQLEFLVAVHRLSRIVLIAHEGCAYYTERLHVRPAELEKRQWTDLAASSERLRNLGAEIEIDVYYARQQGGKVCFEKVEI